MGVGDFCILPKFDPKIVLALYHHIATGTYSEDTWYIKLNEPASESRVSENVVYLQNTEFTEMSVTDNTRDDSILDSGDTIEYYQACTNLLNGYDCNEVVSDSLWSALLSFHERASKHLDDEGVKKGVLQLTKKLRKITSKSSLQSFSSSLFSFSKEINAPNKAGTLKKEN